jgi:hypothetical protein
LVFSTIKKVFPNSTPNGDSTSQWTNCNFFNFATNKRFGPNTYLLISIFTFTQPIIIFHHFQTFHLSNHHCPVQITLKHGRIAKWNCSSNFEKTWDQRLTRNIWGVSQVQKASERLANLEKTVILDLYIHNGEEVQKAIKNTIGVTPLLFKTEDYNLQRYNERVRKTFKNWLKYPSIQI